MSPLVANSSGVAAAAPAPPAVSADLSSEQLDQTSVLLASNHTDLISDVAYNFDGRRIATAGADQRVCVWERPGDEGEWAFVDAWTAHNAAVTRVAWAHPSFGNILATASFDRSIRIWQEVSNENKARRWVERAKLIDARGSVRDLAFAPHAFGLKLASISSDSCLRVHECIDISNLSRWTLMEEIDVPSAVAVTSVPSSGTAASALTAAQPRTGLGSSVSGGATPVGGDTSPAAGVSTPGGLGVTSGARVKEADGGWALSWCKERWWGQVIAVAAGRDGTVKLFHLDAPSSSRSSILSIVPSNPVASPLGTSTTRQIPSAPIASIAWAPSVGRSYHLLATGSRDGFVRIWKVLAPESRTSGLGSFVPGPLSSSRAAQGAYGSLLGGVREQTPAKEGWSAESVANFDHHGASVGRVEWNVFGTVLSSSGDDGCVRLWKASYVGEWQLLASLTAEQAHATVSGGSGEDVAMES